MEEELGKIKCGRATVKPEGRKVLCLAYADDVMLMAEKENEIRSMLEMLKWYLDRKKLELNAEKRKVIRFRKSGGRLAKKY